VGIIRRIFNGETIKGATLSPVQRRLRKQRLKLRGTELRVEIDAVRRQLDAMRSAEDLPGHVALREWLEGQGLAFPDTLDPVTVQLADLNRLVRATKLGRRKKPDQKSAQLDLFHSCMPLAFIFKSPFMGWKYPLRCLLNGTAWLFSLKSAPFPARAPQATHSPINTADSGYFGLFSPSSGSRKSRGKT
jgi:hypothetical protein